MTPLLAGSGFDAMVDATPLALGRDPEGVARISARTGLHVVMTTGVHSEAHYPSGHWLHGEPAAALATRFVRDLQHGAPAHDDGSGTPTRTPSGDAVRAGVLKAGIGYWSVSGFEATVPAPVAEAHNVTGAPVMFHLEHGSAAFELLDRLTRSGVQPGRVALAHVVRNPDPGLHAELAATDAYLGYDGAARAQRWSDSALLACLAATCERDGSTPHPARRGRGTPPPLRGRTAACRVSPTWGRGSCRGSGPPSGRPPPTCSCATTRPAGSPGPDQPASTYVVLCTV